MKKEFKPLISIIVPVYNAEKKIYRCLDSILSQTITNIEIILIDDGSMDTSLAILKSYQKMDSRITVLSQRNEGPSTARNRGIKIAKGKYIGFVDADDYIESNMYQNLYQKAEESLADMVVCAFNILNQNGSSSALYLDLPKGDIKNAAIEELLLSRFYNGSVAGIASLWNKLIKKSFILDNNLLLDVTRKRAEDYWFNFYALKHTNHINYINDALYNYDTSTESSIMKSYREDQYEQFLKSRMELIHQHNGFKFEIDKQIFDSQFVNNVEEYIFQIFSNVKVEAYKRAYSVIQQQEFINAFNNIKPLGKIEKLLKFTIKNKMFLMTLVIYITKFKIFSFKSNLLQYLPVR